MPRDFRDLNIWKEGYVLLLEVYRATESFPTEERFGLRSQLRRSANSVIANIAEGWGRRYPKEKIRPLSIAQGEISETVSHLSVAAGLGYVPQEEANRLAKRYSGLSVGVERYMNSLKIQQKAAI